MSYQPPVAGFCPICHQQAVEWNPERKLNACLACGHPPPKAPKRKKRAK